MTQKEIEAAPSTKGIPITKEWIEGIRKGWKKLLDSLKKETSAKGALQKIDQINIWIDRLTEDLLYNKGLWQPPETESEEAKRKKYISMRGLKFDETKIKLQINDLLEKASKQVTKGKDMMQFLMDTSTPGTSIYKFNKEWFENNLKKYDNDIQKWEKEAVKDDASKFAKDIDSIISGNLLRTLSTTLTTWEKVKSTMPSDWETTPSETQYSIGNLKVVFQDADYILKELKKYPEELEQLRKPHWRPEYIETLKKAQSLLNVKKLGFLWYGTVFVQCENCGGPNRYSTPEKAWGVGATYKIGTDDIRLYISPQKYVTDVIIHEIGHRYYYKYMSMADREEFSSYFGKVPGVSEYGKTVSDEDFAEVFAWYVLDRKLTRDQLERFRKFLGRKTQRGAAMKEAAESPFRKTSEESFYGQVYHMDLKRDWFLHFTPTAHAQGILQSKKLLMSPPYKKFGPDAVYAISTQWGRWKPGVQFTHLPKDKGEITGILFQTDKPPTVGYPEEVMWKSDVPLKKIKLITLAQAQALLKQAPYHPLDKDFQVTYTQASKTMIRAALNITKKDIDPWKSDLRRMTKIYRDIKPEAPDAVEKLLEKSLLFQAFSKKFHDWIYFTILQKIDPSKEGYAEQRVRTKAWDAYHSLPSSRETQWDYKTDQHVPSPHRLANERDKVIRKYNAAFNATFKALEDYLDLEGGELKREKPVEKYTIGPFQVLVRTKGTTEYSKGELDALLHQLTDVGKKIERAGFPSAVKNLTVIADFYRNDLRGGHYRPDKDELALFPLGFESRSFIHECGHRFYFKSLPPRARGHWEEILNTRQLAITEEDIHEFYKKYIESHDPFHLSSAEGIALVKRTETNPEKEAKFIYLMDRTPAYTFKPEEILQHYLKFTVDDKVNLEELTDYGATNPREAFAEAFTEYIIKGPRALKPWTRSFFIQISRAGGARVSLAATDRIGATVMRVSDYIRSGCSGSTSEISQLMKTLSSFEEQNPYPTTIKDYVPKDTSMADTIEALEAIPGPLSKIAVDYGRKKLSMNKPLISDFEKTKDNKWVVTLVSKGKPKTEILIDPKSEKVISVSN
jgi:hypothetical protein